MENARAIATEAMAIVEAKQKEEWPAVISLDTPLLPRLDNNAFPKWAGDYASALAHFTETPLELAMSMVLAACAAASARRFRVMVRQGYYEPTNLWLACALAPGNRKSSVQEAASAPLLSWERLQARTMAAEIASVTSDIKTKEARVKELRNKAAKAKLPPEAISLSAQAAELEALIPELPIVPQLWTSDATPERLGTLLHQNKEQLAWLSSEGGLFDLLSGRYSGGIPNLDLVLKAHSGDAERVDRGSRPPVYLKRPLLTIGLSPQPDVLKGLSTKPGFRGRGLLGRFLYLIPQSPLGYRTLQSQPIPQPVEALYHSGLHAILNIAAAKNEEEDEIPYTVNLSAEAYQAWYEYAQGIEHSMRPNGYFENTTDWAGKAPGAVARIAGVLHVVEHAHGQPHSLPISLHTMQCAIHIISVVAQHSMYAFEMMGADASVNSARLLWRWIERQRRAQFTVRDAHQALKGTFPRVKEIEGALDVLVERGYVSVEFKIPNVAGRPSSPKVNVRPDIVATWA